MGKIHTSALVLMEVFNQKLRNKRKRSLCISFKFNWKKEVAAKRIEYMKQVISYFKQCPVLLTAYNISDDCSTEHHSLNIQPLPSNVTM